MSILVRRAVALRTGVRPWSGAAGAIFVALTQAPTAHGAVSAAATERDSSTTLECRSGVTRSDDSCVGFLRVAQYSQTDVSSGQSLDDAQSAAAGSKEPQVKEELQQVLVTAQKRLERLQDVPVPVTAVSAAQLADSNRSRLQDFYAQVPGFALSTDGMGVMVALRGIAPAGFGNPTVGFMVDDVPYGASTAYGGGFLAPEIDPGDLARVEVLRGPQGTLYGASSMGGLVKYVTVSPSVDRLSGRIQTGLSGVRYGRKAGYNISGAVNVPLSDSFAVLASGFRHRDPGYIENIRSGERGLNEADVTGGHLSALWEPSDVFSLKLSALLQKATQTGSAFTTNEPGFGDMQQDFLAHSSTNHKTFAAYSATATAKLGDIDLVAIAGYGDTQLNSTTDLTTAVGELTATAFPTANTLEDIVVKGRKFSSELRLTVPIGDRFDWLIGGFYTHESTPTVDDWIATNDDTRPIDRFARFVVDTSYAEKAAFTDLTYRVTDRFDVQVGGRYSQIHQTYQSTDSGIYVPLFEGAESPLVFPGIAGSAHASTYLVTPRFKITPDMMLYARLASGYRASGVNPPTLVQVDGVPSTYSPDKTLNYEVGLKGSALDRALSFDASVYYIDWKDIQIGAFDPGSSISFYTNGGRAKSQGAELSIEAVPTRGLRIGGWLAWNDAVLTRDMPPDSSSFGLAGYRLPFSSRISGNASVDYEVPIGEYTASVGWTVTYVGERIGDFAPTAARQVLPAYATNDLRVGATLSDWTVDLNLNNVTDRRGRIGGGIGSLNPTYFEFIQPRTVSLSVARTF